MSGLFRAVKALVPYELRQEAKRRLFHVKDMHSRLANLRQAGFACSGAIDGGAYEGEWTRQFWAAFPGVPCLLVEPLPEKGAVLERVAAEVAGSRHVGAALGRAPGKARFQRGGTNSSLVRGEPEPGQDALLSVDVITLDALLEQDPAFRPNLLKLDLQGFELECLGGCADLAARFEVILLEVSVLPLGGAPRFTDVDRWLEGRGFRLYDVLPQYYRPLDGALWQCDAFYVRRDSSLIQSMEWA